MSKLDDRSLWDGHGHSQAHIRQRIRLKFEWVCCCIIVLLLTTWATNNDLLISIDNARYDRLIRQDAKPQRQDIVIIAIDDVSVLTLGSWPWSRDILSDLLDRLAAAKPRAVAIALPNLLKHEETAADLRLAMALKQPDLGYTFLSVTLNASEQLELQKGWQLPLPLFQHSVSALGHTNIEVDADGVTRRMSLIQEYEGKAFPSLPLLLSAKHAGFYEHISTPANPLEGEESAHRQVHEKKVLLPFAGESSRYTTFPFSSILHDVVPPEHLTDKLVLIGITAKEISNQYKSPISNALNGVHGIEIEAAALEGLLDRNLIEPLTIQACLALTLGSLIVWMLMLYGMGPRVSVLALILVNCFLFGLSSLLLVKGRLWWPVSSLAVGTVVAYILWSWRRSSIMFADLKLRARALQMAFTKPLSQETPNSDFKATSWQDVLTVLDEGINIIEINQLEAMETLEAMPEAVLVLDANGIIKMANAKAHALLKLMVLKDTSALDLVAPTFAAKVNNAEQWQSLMRHVANRSGKGVEFTVPQGADVLIRVSNIRNLDPEFKQYDAQPWWIATMVDITEIKQLQRKRDDTLRLLLHDLRAPQAAILTLLRMDKQNAPEQRDYYLQFKERITLQVNETLDLADDFVWQLRAESSDYDLQEVDMIQLCHEVLDRAWPMATAKHIKLQDNLSLLTESVHINLDDTDNHVTTFGDRDGVWLNVEPRLMQRVLFNLLENAIKYSPSHTTIMLGMTVVRHKHPENPEFNNGKPIELERVLITVTDQGDGISPENLAYVFDPHTRFSTSTTKDTGQSGHGIGLRFVKTVVEAHHGIIQVESVLSHGSVFTITLPYV